MLNNKKVCFIGAGAMAEAVLSGMLNKRIIKPGAVSVTNRSDRFRLDELVYNFGIFADADQKRQSIAEADILILAMKPKDSEAALTEIKELVRPDQLVISVVAGISTSFIHKKLGKDAPIIRSMPNTAASIGKSATGLCRGETASDNDLDLAAFIFKAIGTVAIVEESLMDAVTAVSGSGPAYMYLLVEAMKDGALNVGLNEVVSRELIIQTLLGAAHMLIETGEDPSLLREKVTSPNGTTEAALNVLGHYRFNEAVIACIGRAAERSKELGKI